MGNIYTLQFCRNTRDKEKIEKAKECYEKASKAYEAIGDKKVIMNVYLIRLEQ